MTGPGEVRGNREKVGLFGLDSTVFGDSFDVFVESLFFSKSELTAGYV